MLDNAKKAIASLTEIGVALLALAHVCSSLAFLGVFHAGSIHSTTCSSFMYMILTFCVFFMFCARFHLFSS